MICLNLNIAESAVNMGCNLCGKAILSPEEFNRGYCTDHEVAPQVKRSLEDILHVNINKLDPTLFEKAMEVYGRQ